MPGARALIGHYELVAAITARLDQLDARVAETEGLHRGRRCARSRRAGTDRRRVDRTARRHVGGPPRSSAHRTRGRGAGRPRQHRRGGRRLPGRAAGAVGARSPRGARSRLRRSAPVRVEPRVVRVRPGGAANARPSATAIRCSRTARCASPASASASSTRRRRRSASSATTPARCAAAISADELLRLALSQPEARADRARPHPLGKRRHHQRGQLPSAEQRGARAVRRRPVHGRRAQRRRRQPRRHQGPPRPAHRRPDHHRRQGDPCGDGAARRRAVSTDLGEAFRRTVAEFEGSVAIGAAAADHPDALYLALRGSGQALYVGLADDCFVVASEPYGVVEETTTFVRMDGESPSPSGSRGQVFVLDGAQAGELDGHSAHGLRRRRAAADRRATSATAQVTTRDIDRGDSPHFLLEGDQRGAGQLPQDGARQDRRDRRLPPRLGRCPRPARRHPRPSRRRQHHQDQGHRSGHRGGRRSQHGRRPRRARPTANSTSIRSPPPSSAASGCVST